MHATQYKMHISPQALSASIKAMENEIGLALLERSFQGTELTPLGEEISAASEAFIEKLDRILAAHRNTSEQEQTNFVFNFFPYVRWTILPQALSPDRFIKTLTCHPHAGALSGRNKAA